MFSVDSENSASTGSVVFTGGQNKNFMSKIPISELPNEDASLGAKKVCKLNYLVNPDTGGITEI